MTFSECASMQIVRQASRARFHRLVSTQPVLVRVRSGRKVILSESAPITLCAGEFCLLPDGLPLTVENIPGGPGGYEAHALPVDRSVFEQAYARMPNLARPTTAAPARLACLAEEAVAVFDLFRSPARETLPAAILALRLSELVTWFALGRAVLNESRPPKFTDKVRLLIEEDPAEDWASGETARRLNVSEATMRRKLALEGTRFSEVVRDVRMTRALAMLQTTGLSIGRIAAEVGYTSASQFAVRFKQRFNLNPRDIRSSDRHIERITASFDRNEADRDVQPS